VVCWGLSSKDEPLDLLLQLGTAGERWAAFGYQYGLGLVLILLGIFAGFHSGVWSRRRRRWLWVVIGGYLLMALMQGALLALGTGG